MSGTTHGITVSRPDYSKEKNRLKKEVSRKSSMANKRIKRLEKNDLTSLSAYQQYADGGSVKFGVAGKDYNQLQSELARVNSFIKNKTSLVRQANAQMKNIASDTGLTYGSVKELPKKLSNFFELASKIEQYLRNVEDSASAIGYQKIWEVINTYVQEEDAELDEILSGGQDMMSSVITHLQMEIAENKVTASDVWTIL